MARIRRFSEQAKSALSPIATRDDNYGTDQFQLKADHADRTEPFDNKFEFDIEGSTIVPVRISHLQKRTHRSLKTLFLAENATYHPSPEFPARDGVLFIPNHDIQESQTETLEKLFPGNEPLAEMPDSSLIALPNQQPVFQVKKSHSNFQVEVTDNRAELQEQSLLTPEIRGAIERHGGEVVYESSPEHADRLVIAFQNFHGNIITPWRLFAHHGPEGGHRFLNYQKAITSATEEIGKIVGDDHTQYILETLPGDPEKRKEYMQTVHDVAMAAKSPVTTGLFGDRSHPWKGEFMNFSAAMHAMNRAHENDITVYGDARAERDDDFHSAQRELELDSAVLRKKPSYGGVGAASALNNIRSKVDESVFNESHREIIAMTSEHLNADDTGLMIYGAGHFESGKSKNNTGGNKSLEEYFRFMPNTQLVVVEMPEGVASLDEYDDAMKEVKEMDPELRKQYFMYLHHLEYLLKGIENLARLLNEEDAYLHPETLQAIPEWIEERDAAFQSLQNIVAHARHIAAHKKTKEEARKQYRSQIEEQIAEDQSEDFIV